MNWNLINPWAKNPEEPDKKQESQSPVPPIAHAYISRVVFFTLAFVLLGGLAVILICYYQDASIKVIFALLGILMVVTTFIFGAALYFALGLLGKRMAASKKLKDSIEDKMISSDMLDDKQRK